MADKKKAQSGSGDQEHVEERRYIGPRSRREIWLLDGSERTNVVSVTFSKIDHAGRVYAHHLGKVHVTQEIRKQRRQARTG